MIQAEYPSSRAMGNPYLRILDLPAPCLPSQLPNDLGYLRQSGGPNRMPLRDESSAGIYRNPTPDLGRPFVD